MTSSHFGGACAPFAHPWIQAWADADYLKKLCGQTDQMMGTTDMYNWNKSSG